VQRSSEETSIRIKDILIFKYYIIFFFLCALYVAKLYKISKFKYYYMTETTQVFEI